MFRPMTYNVKVLMLQTFVEYTRSTASSKIKFVAWSYPLNVPCQGNQHISAFHPQLHDIIQRQPAAALQAVLTTMLRPSLEMTEIVAARHE